MILSRDIRAIVFDFDGVLTVAGEDAKQDAWKPIEATWMPVFCKLRLEAEKKFRHAKGSRFDILRETFQKAGCPETLIESMVTVYAEAYGISVIELLKQSGMPLGAKDMLGQLANRFPLFLNSGTPEKSLLEITELFEISESFVGIFGMPSKKVQNLQRAMATASCQPDQILFVGDGLGDLDAATEFGCQFVGIPKPWNGWTKESVNFPLISVVTELPTLLR